MPRPGKSDVLDAHAIAQLLREDLVLDMTRLRNRLHALLLECDPEYRRALRSLKSQAGLRALLGYTAPGQTALDRAREQAVRQLAQQLALLAAQEQALRHELERAVAA